MFVLVILFVVCLCCKDVLGEVRVFVCVKKSIGCKCECSVCWCSKDVLGVGVCYLFVFKNVLGVDVSVPK